jgi:alkaline phosphatase
VLFIGDGMGAEQVKAGGLYLHGQSGSLAFESFPYQAQVTTASADSPVTDSAAAATAFATGVKVNNGVLALRLPGDGSELPTILEFAKSCGLSTGLVTTNFITHATPAGFGAHAGSRAVDDEIAADYLSGSRPDLLLGGAGTTAGSGSGMTAAKAQSAGYRVIRTAAELQAVTALAEPLSGQFGAGHMPYEADRLHGILGLPHLDQMTARALDLLDDDPDGFFLMVEGGRIDQAAHDHDITRLVGEMAAFDAAVQSALAWADSRAAALIVVTADHETGGLLVTQGNGAGLPPTVTWTASGHTGMNVPLYAFGDLPAPLDPLLDNTQLAAWFTAEGFPSP